jgi:hypothetical protein
MIYLSYHKNNGEYQTDIDQVYTAGLLEGQFTHG